MAARSATARRKKAGPAGILLRYRNSDTPYGVSRRTAIKLANTLGLSETQVIHVALAQFARQTLPRYEADDGPLSDEQRVAIESRVTQQGFTSTRKRLY